MDRYQRKYNELREGGKPWSIGYIVDSVIGRQWCVSDDKASDGGCESQNGGSCSGFRRWGVAQVFATKAECHDVDDEYWDPSKALIPAIVR